LKITQVSRAALISAAMDDSDAESKFKNVLNQEYLLYGWILDDDRAYSHFFSLLDL